MKKILILTLSLVLLAGSFSACSKENTDSTTEPENSTVLSGAEENATYYSASAGISEETTADTAAQTVNTTAEAEENNTYTVG